MKEPSCDVIIVGAGIAGLTCARELISADQGLNVRILEASDRIGGRVKSAHMDGGTVLEMGAHYIHGTVGNPLYDFAISKGIIEKDDKAWKPYKTLHCFHNDVSSVCSEVKLYQAIDIVSDYDYLSSLYDLTDEEAEGYRSVGDFVDEKFEKKLLEYSGDLELCTALKSVFASEIRSESDTNGSSCLHSLDTFAFRKYIDLTGDLHYTLGNQNGYGDIVQAIADDVDMKSIILNHQVNNISHKNDKYEISCSNGAVFFSHVVILTVSVEVLKGFVTDAVVELPQWKVNAINSVDLGKIVKVYFKFNTPIEKGIDFLKFYPSNKNFESKHFEGYNSVFCIERINKSDWWLLWLNEELVPNIHGGIGNQKIPDNTRSALCNLLSELMKNYTNVPDLTIEKSSVVVSDWTHNPLYLGSYSYVRTGTNLKQLEYLGNPVFNGHSSLLFAGEMTDSEFYSTTHGAYRSGIREAKRLLKMRNQRDLNH